MPFFDVVTTGILLGGTYALVALGLNLVFGVVQVVNFAHGEFVMLGMYSAYLAKTQWGIDPYLSVFVIAPIAFVLGAVVQKLLIEPLLDQPMMQVFATFGLVILFQNIVLALSSGVPRSVRTASSSSTIDIGVIISVPRLIVLAVATVLAVGLVVLLKRTIFGTAIRAVSQDRATARLMGINVSRTYVVVFGLSIALAAVAGALLSPVYTATPSIGFSFILPAFAVVVLGGLGSVPGAYVGGMIVGLVEAFAGYYLDSSLKQAVWFALFFVVLVVKPSGLMGGRGAATA
jgi:branched-chain amino acid transport system permease protein